MLSTDHVIAIQKGKDSTAKHEENKKKKNKSRNVNRSDLGKSLMEMHMIMTTCSTILHVKTF